jgi:DNA repair exonuclease SbcCD nuclease subunit
MSAPYALVSDLHCHNWSQFSQIGSDGVNTRLRIILDELIRAAQTLKKAGGTTLRVAGDLFHVRGNIAPSVLNPTFATFKWICEALEIDVEIIPGNHDLEGLHADELGNAMQQLDLIEGVEVITKPTVCEDGTVMLPWIESLDELRKEAAKLKNPNADLIIHAPLNGVIRGLPDHGLDPVEVSKWGYRRVFTGHYHNHTAPMDGAISIGATTHQTWSDPNTAAGFLIVYPDRYEFHESQAPKFVNVDQPIVDTTAVRNNYCRIRLQDVEADELDKFKADLKAAGAAGIVDHSTKKRPDTRGVAAPQNLTLEVSVAQFVANDLDVDKSLSKKRIANDALDVLRAARTVGAE